MLTQAKPVIASIFLCLTLSALVRATDNTPEETVKAFWAAMQQQDWATAVKRVHPKSLTRIRAAANNYVDTLLRVDKYGGNLRTQFGVSSRSEYDGLSDEIVLERVFQRMSAEPGFVEILKATTWQIIGSTRERDDLVHVTYRTEVSLKDAEGQRLKTATFTKGNQLFVQHVTVRLSEPDIDRAEVISIKRDGAAWLVLLGDESEDALDRWENAIRDFIHNMQESAKPTAPKKGKAKSQSKLKPGGRSAHPGVPAPR